MDEKNKKGCCHDGSDKHECHNHENGNHECCHGKNHENGEHECCHGKGDGKKECKHGGDGQKRIKELEAELANAMALANEYNTKCSQYLNTATYYKNQCDETKNDLARFKERNKNIEEQAKQKANEFAVKKILPILDDFDGALRTVSPELMQGFVMIYSSMLSTIKELGAVEIVCKGEKLDPEKHNCIDTTIADNESQDGTIAAVYQKGYMFEATGEVIRPANVSVYKA